MGIKTGRDPDLLPLSNVARVDSARQSSDLSAVMYRAVCGKRATLLANVDRADRKPRCETELTKRQDVKRPDIRGRGE